MNNFYELSKKRQSTRFFSSKKLERKDIEKCIKAASNAPSACNSQPWKFIVVDDDEIRQEVAKCTFDNVVSFNKFVSKAPVIIVGIIENVNISSFAGSKIKKIDYKQMDFGMAIENLCLQATELEIGSCILGWFNEKKLKNILNIPKIKRVGLLIAIGYPLDKTIRDKKRKNQDEIMSFNKY